MPGEIVHLRFERARSGSHWLGYFLDVLVPPITTPAGVPIPITPSSALPAVDRLIGIFTDAELLALDQGELMFTPMPIRLTADEDDNVPALLLRLRAEYAALDDQGRSRVDLKRREWRRYGRRTDAT